MFFYLIVFFTKWVFNTNFQFWISSFKVFNVQKLVPFIQYLPIFFAFYLANSLFVNGALRIDKMSEKKNLLLAALSNVLGIFVLTVIQYVPLFTTGVATFGGDSWLAIYIMGLCMWQLFLAPYILRHFYKLTGKNWLGALVVSGLYCLSAVANTAISSFWF